MNISAESGFPAYFLHTGSYLQCKRSSMSYLHGRSHEKAILSLRQVGVPSKHAQNADEQHLISSNSTKRNINGQIRAICMQDSGSRGYKNNLYKTK